MKLNPLQSASKNRVDEYVLWINWIFTYYSLYIKLVLGNVEDKKNWRINYNYMYICMLMKECVHSMYVIYTVE